jgi:hypothetical protein
MQTITIVPSPYEWSFQRAKKGSVWHLELHGLRWPLEVRQNPPRIRLLEDAKLASPVRAEVLDPWPNAPEFYPPEWAPGAKPGPGSLYMTSPNWVR